MLYFYGDPHFGNDAIRRYENRPFNNTKTMDIALITSSDYSHGLARGVLASKFSL